MLTKRKLLAAAGVGAALVLALPATAFASTTATVATPGTTSWTNPAAGALLTTSAQCSTGLVSGGGVQVTGGNGIHIMETEPSTNGTSAVSNGATDPTYWLGYGGIGGQGTGTFTVQPLAVCFTNTTINHTQVVVNSTAGPTATGGMTSATATCPANTLLLGGGAQSTLASNKSVKAIASYPSNSSGNATADGGTNPTSWTAVALNGGMSGTGNTTAAFAICSGSGINVSGITVMVKHTHVAGPTTANTAVTATTGSCGVSGTMIGGGASISGGDPTTSAFTAPGSQGDHLDGDYPSDSIGNPGANGSPTSNWSATGVTGGMSSPSTSTDVWGLCMN